MPDTTPDLSTPEAQTPTNQEPFVSTYPPIATLIDNWKQNY